MPQCRFCGEVFDNELGLVSHRGQKHKGKCPWHDPELLSELYIERELSATQIAEDMDCGRGTILRYLEKYGIETRGNNEAQVVLYRRQGNPATLCLDTEGYEIWNDSFNGSVRKVRVHRLLAVAEYGFDSVRDKPVHHGKEGGRLPPCEIPWANWAGNIEVLEWGEHSRHHNPHALSGFEQLRVNELYRNGECSQLDLAELFDVSQSVVSRCLQ